MRDSVEQDEITQDQNGTIYPIESLFYPDDEREYQPMSESAQKQFDADFERIMGNR